jgi:hypothetical protein
MVMVEKPFNEGKKFWCAFSAAKKKLLIFYILKEKRFDQR